jgi:hypothetical protein
VRRAGNGVKEPIPLTEHEQAARMMVRHEIEQAFPLTAFVHDHSGIAFEMETGDWNIFFTERRNQLLEELSLVITVAQTFD